MPIETLPSSPRFRDQAGWLLSIIVVVLGAVSAPVDAAETAEDLVIFIDSSARSDVARRFEGEHLPAIQQAAEALGAPWTVVDVAERGAPHEVHITPLIVHQSPRGRAWFQGRYVDAGKLAHFIRTSRAVPPLSIEQTKTDVAIWQRGRSKVLAPIKVTNLQGALPAGHDPAAFAAMARDAILDGTTRFGRTAAVELGPADRAFYMDFHPFATEDGRLFVSTALFSQFNCIEPIFEGFDAPTEGTLANAADVFVRAARALEAEIARQIATSTIGDGFDPVAAAVPIVDWPALGLPLPERAAGVSADAVAGIELARRWRITPPAEGGGPRLIFRFPPPLERYSGEVTGLSGLLELAEGLELVGASGWIEADTSTVTMGEQSLDDAIHGKMIHVAKYPAARFELDSIAAGAQPVAFGRTSQASASGTFQMVGRNIPLSVQAQIEPVIREDGQPVLHVNAGFELRLDDPFGIAGPDGPAPARDTLVFFLDFTMEPADGEADARPATAP